jgi:hypothetical protein
MYDVWTARRTRTVTWQVEGYSDWDSATHCLARSLLSRSDMETDIRVVRAAVTPTPSQSQAHARGRDPQEHGWELE